MRTIAQITDDIIASQAATRQLLAEALAHEDVTDHQSGALASVENATEHTQQSIRFFQGLMATGDDLQAARAFARVADAPA